MWPSDVVVSRMALPYARTLLAQQIGDRVPCTITSGLGVVVLVALDCEERARCDKELGHLNQRRQVAGVVNGLAQTRPGQWPAVSIFLDGQDSEEFCKCLAWYEGHDYLINRFFDR